MELWKFEDLLKTQTLYFARPDQFEDPFEGLFSPGNGERQSKSDEVFHSLYRIAEDTHPTGYERIHRNVVFINCWHRNRRESFQMWRAYTKSTASVVVTTSVKAVLRFIPGAIMKSTVKYASLDMPRTRFGHNALFFYKPTNYSFERELRLLRSPAEDEVFHSEREEDKFRRVAVPVHKLIHRVITHPHADVCTKTKVNRLLSAYLPRLRCEDSALRMRCRTVC